ncbi:hypothetical protein GGR54DRAFT_295078 [Hypoxylon sp. NC1633]|nr:hypothetical protein GGR54DRAFT_295078 [Hypoxylon sp. NC1633]
MAPHPYLRITIPPNPFITSADTLSSSTTLCGDGFTHNTDDLQTQLKTIVSRVTHDTCNAAGTEGEELEENRQDDDKWDDDDESNYSDDGDYEHLDELPVDFTAESFPESDSITDDNCEGMCSPESYAEYSVNPYSVTDPMAKDIDCDTRQSPKPAPYVYDSYFAIPVDFRKKRRADASETYQRFAEPRKESVSEILAKLSGDLNNAHSEIKAEESASLRSLQELCAC